jgi:HrpA-like RNA helicase
VTHLVLDEVHERNIDADLLCLLVRQLLEKQRSDAATATAGVTATATAGVLDSGSGSGGAPGSGACGSGMTRVVLMSATFNARLFCDYYGPVVAPREVPCLFVGVKRSVT